MNIGQAFLQNAEQGKLEGTGQPTEIFGHVETGLNAAAFRETLHIPFCGGGKTGFVQQGRMQQMRDVDAFLRPLAGRFGFERERRALRKPIAFFAVAPIG